MKLTHIFIQALAPIDPVLTIVITTVVTICLFITRREYKRRLAFRQMIKRQG